jgi:hypothetical protein
VSSGDLKTISVCLNADCNLFLENGLHQTALDLAEIQTPEVAWIIKEKMVEL